ncbi:hypothetical protein ATE47_04245 [Chryseobacterium sp. IHB B 17019]|uniref:hypothetical protein n=1 Tax=Chryseobacterium sp. IHB B 17019 TaxID=1721091 RepID=UPI00071F372B|nr:hypothetical protein [Chryseobacterium sp. IHB B 17019]ALR29780.1 hypothetical protein ATE47_04245 [Chryseobacterium sp. IHB B 17019]
METPTKFMIRLAKKYADQSESFINMLQDFKYEFVTSEKEFIKNIYIDALKDVDLPQEEKDRKAEEYYVNNFKNID